MTQVTLLGKMLCNKGAEFTYLGPLNDCKNCKLKTVCFNLKPGKTYKVMKVREKQHSCTVHEQHVYVVEVEEQPIIGVVEKKFSKGDETQPPTTDCRHIGCSFHDVCTSPAIRPGKTYRIVKTLESIDCLKKNQLKKAELKE